MLANGNDPLVKEIAQRSAAQGKRCVALRCIRPHAALRYAVYTFTLRCADVLLAFDKSASEERKPDSRILTLYSYSYVFTLYL